MQNNYRRTHLCGFSAPCFADEHSSSVVLHQVENVISVLVDGQAAALLGQG